MLGHAIAQEVSCRTPAAAAWFDPKSGHMGSVVGKIVLGQIFSEYFSFPCQFSFHQMPHPQLHLPSGAGTIGQIDADVPSGLSHTPPQGKKSTGLHWTNPYQTWIYKTTLVHSRWMGLPLCSFNALCAKNIKTNPSSYHSEDCSPWALWLWVHFEMFTNSESDIMSDRAQQRIVATDSIANVT
jgi:hypothetical protein